MNIILSLYFFFLIPAASQELFLFSLFDACHEQRTLREALAPALPPDARNEFLTAPQKEGTKDDIPFGDLLVTERGAVMQRLLFEVFSRKRLLIGEPIPQPVLEELPILGVWIFSILEETYDLPSSVLNLMPCLAYHPEMDQILTDLSEEEGRIPNDPLAIDAWHLAEYPGTNAFQGWSNFTGQASDFAVGVVDSGCSLHPDLEENICVQGDGSGCESWDFGGGGFNAFAEPLHLIHGTPVSGCIAAIGNNQLGSSGICWGCKISCMKITHPNGTMLLSTALRSYEYMLRKGVRLSNHSYGAYTVHYKTMYTAIEAMERAGHLLIAAAGNDQLNLDDPDEPMRLIPGGITSANVVTVGSSNRAGSISTFSNYGEATVDLFAPGEGIVSTQNTMTGAKFGEFKGTSFSSPMVAGAAAVLWAANPNLKYTDIKEALLSTVHEVPSMAAVSVAGGVLDLGGALSSIEIVMDEGVVVEVSTPSKDNTHLAYEKSVGLAARPASVETIVLTFFGILQF